MKIKEVYKKYQIPPNLQDHMYRVAAVGSVVVDYLADTIKLDKELVIQALLVHDIGNIIKFDFKNEEFYSKRDVEHWRKVRQEFVDKYGEDENIGTLKIVGELGLSERIIEVLSNMGTSSVNLTTEPFAWYCKVCSYADFRVAPHGVVGIVERWDDLMRRYAGRQDIFWGDDAKKKERKKQNSLTIEQQLQAESSHPLAAISDELIAPLVAELPEYDIHFIKDLEPIVKNGFARYV